MCFDFPIAFIFYELSCGKNVYFMTLNQYLFLDVSVLSYLLLIEESLIMFLSALV